MSGIYCMKCKKKTPNHNESIHHTSNGRKQMKAMCGCGTRKSSFIAHVNHVIHHKTHKGKKGKGIISGILGSFGL